MAVYELTLTPEYVKTWRVVDALRELFQNALDQTQLTGVPYSWTYDKKKKELVITSPKSWLDRSTLLLGSSSKADDTGTIGQFGEGYKLASLVLLREGLSLCIENENYNETWIPTLKPSKRFNGVSILQFSIDGRIKHKHTVSKNLRFIVSNLSNELWEEYKGYNLSLIKVGETIDTKNGSILLDKTFSQRIYVNGLYVASMEDLRYGYNFIPAQLPLDRDRSVLPSYDTLTAIANLWLLSESPLIEDLLAKGAKDVSYIQYSSLRYKNYEKQGSYVYTKFREKYGSNAYPVTTDEEFRALTRLTSEFKPVIVSPSYRYYLAETGFLPKIDVEHAVSLKGRLEALRDSLADRATEEEIQEFNDIISKMWQ